MTTLESTPDVFAAVASPVRRSLLSILRSGETPATELAGRFDLTQPAISQQLKILRRVGLVGERRVGRNRLYHLNPGPLREVADWVKQYEYFWSDRLDRLSELVDRAEPARPSSAPVRSVRRRRSRRGGRT